MCDKVLHTVLDIISAADTLTLPMDVWRIVEHYAYRLYYYSHGRDLLEVLRLTEKAATYPALSTKANQTYYIFLSDDLNTEQERWWIAHELGHIALGHLEGDSPLYEKPEAEEQADLFALTLLAPCPVLEQYGITGTENIHRCTGISLNASRRVYRCLEEYRMTRREAARQEEIGRRAAVARDRLYPTGREPPGETGRRRPPGLLHRLLRPSSALEREDGHRVAIRQADSRQ